MTRYYALLTNLGAAKLANAAALGTKLQITQMAVGDGGGTLPTPNASQTSLVAEKRRAALNALSVDTANSSQIIAEQVIPEGDGGFWVREIGLFDADGVMIAVANCPETYKPQLQEGSGRTQTVRMILIVNSTDAVTLKIDPSVVLATRKYVDDNVIEVKAWADSLMAKHLAAADPHAQYAPKASPAFVGKPIAPTPDRLDDSALIATTHHVKLVVGAYAPLESPGLTGKPLAPTATKSDNGFQLANTAHVKLVVADYAPLGTPAFTGTPTAPTAVAGNNSLQIANTAFVKAAIAELVAAAPGALDTLKELADSLGNDPHFSTTVLNALAGKMDISAGVTAKMKYGCPLIGSLIYWPLELMPHEIWPDMDMEFIPYVGQTFDGAKFPLLAKLHPSLRLPADMRDEFVRGWDSGRGGDAGRVLMSNQGDAARPITGSVEGRTQSTASRMFGTNTSGVFTTSGASGDYSTGTASAALPSDRLSTLSINSALQVPTAAENRPRNVAWNMIVRAK